MANQGDFVDARVPVQGSYNRASTVAGYSNNFLKAISPNISDDQSATPSIPSIPDYNSTPPQVSTYQAQSRPTQNTRQPVRPIPPAPTYGHTYSTPPQSVPDFFNRTAQTFGDIGQGVGNWVGSFFGGSR